MQLFKNRYFLLGNLLLIILAIPLTLFLIRRQQELRGSAAPTTTLAIEPNTVNANTCQNPITMDVFVDPDKNLVSIVDLYVVYDATKLQLTRINPNKTNFPLTLRGPNYTSGKANVSLSIGSDVTRAIQQKTKVATLEFKPLAATSGGAVTVSLDKAQTRVFSLSKTDEAGENVLLNTLDTAVTITAQANCPAVSPGVTNTATPSATPRITSAVTPTTAATTPSPTTPPLVNQAPVCTALTAVQTSGAAPLTVNFTAKGTDTNNTIAKATFNYGDGPSQDVTTGGGIGTNALNLSTTHTFTTSGTYPVAVTLTDVDGAVSSASASCAQTITVTSSSTGGTNGGGTGGGAAGGGSSGGTQPTPTLESPGSVLQTVGIVGGIMIALAGGFFLLML